MSIRFSAALVALSLTVAAPVFAQAGDLAGELRVSGQAGEQADGYLGLVSGGADVQARVDQVNIKRKALYTELATQRSVTVQDVAESTACKLLAERVAVGQFYKLDVGGFLKRTDGPMPLPARCPKS